MLTAQQPDSSTYVLTLARAHEVTGIASHDPVHRGRLGNRGYLRLLQETPLAEEVAVVSH